MSFVLDPRLREDTAPIGRLPLTRARLHRDARYPWVVLVPARPSLRELFDLSPADRHALTDETAAVAELLSRTLGAHKINVGALGNLVPQLHVHVIARFEGDDAWPGPVWGAHPPLAYTPELLGERIALLAAAFADLPGFVAEPGDAAI